MFAEIAQQRRPDEESQISGDVKTSAGRRDAISSINSVTRLMALAAVSLQARLQANPAMASAVDTVTGLGASFGLL